MSDTDYNAPNGSIGENDDAGNAFVKPGDIVIDPGGNSGSGSAPERRTRRGRPPGSTNKKRQTTQSIVGIEKTLLSIHAVCASFFKTPELALDEDEAKLLAQTSTELASHYNVMPDEKTQAWVNLFMALGAVYGTRAYVIYNKQTKPAPKPSDVVHPVFGGVN